jgi:hypothetical protein
VKTKTPKLVAVWHGHHDCSSPLEVLTESFASRMKTINIVKFSEETLDQFARRKELFKLVKGKLPVKLVAAWDTYNTARASYKPEGTTYDTLYNAYAKARTEYNKAWDAFNTAIQDSLPAILRLHKKECGCGWTPDCTNIFVYTDKRKEKQSEKDVCK